MQIVIPGKFSSGLVGRTISPDNKLLVQSNDISNFIDMSPENNDLVPVGAAFSANGLVTSGVTSKVKTSLLDNSNAITFRALVRVQAGSEQNLTTCVIGSYSSAPFGLGLFTWISGAAPAISLQFRIAFSQKIVSTGAKETGVLAVNIQTGLSVTPTDSGWLYLVGKLDAVNKTCQVKVMNKGLSSVGVISPDRSALSADRGVVDALGSPLTHSVGSGESSIGGRIITTAKAEIFNRLTTDVEDLAQYAADKKFLCPAFGISTVGWS